MKHHYPHIQNLMSQLIMQVSLNKYSHTHTRHLPGLVKQRQTGGTRGHAPSHTHTHFAVARGNNEADLTPTLSPFSYSFTHSHTPVQPLLEVFFFCYAAPSLSRAFFLFLLRVKMSS